MRQSYKTIGLWVILIIFFVAFYNVFSEPKRADGDWKQVMDAAAAGQLDFLEVTPGADAQAFYRDGRIEVIRRPQTNVLAEIQRAGGIVVYRREESSLSGVLIAWLPMVFVCVLVFFFMRRLQTTTAGANDWDVKNFEVPSRNVSVTPELNGLDDAKATMQRALEGGPRVLLLTGTHASGKSALIEWLAAKSKRPLFQRSAAEFVHMFVGVGAARVTKFMTVAATSNAPCIVAVEDIEAIAMKREQFAQAETGKQRKVDEYMQTMLQLKDLLDAQKLPSNVVFVATTSHVDWLDPEFAARFTRIDLPKR